MLDQEDKGGRMALPRLVIAGVALLAGLALIPTFTKPSTERPLALQQGRSNFGATPAWRLELNPHKPRSEDRDRQRFALRRHCSVEARPADFQISAAAPRRALPWRAAGEVCQVSVENHLRAPTARSGCRLPHSHIECRRHRRRLLHRTAAKHSHHLVASSVGQP